MKNSEREELARLTLAERTRKAKNAKAQSARRTQQKERGLRSLTLSVPDDADLIARIRHYATEQGQYVTLGPQELRAELRPMTLDVVDHPVVRDMVIEFAKRLSDHHMFANEDPIPEIGEPVPHCSECGAPRMSGASRNRG